MRTSIFRVSTLSLNAIALLLIGGALEAAEPGTATLASQTADSVTLASGADRVFVRVLKPNLLQVDYRPGNQTSPNTLIIDPDFASKTWSPGTVSITDNASDVVLTTSAMVVKISKSPCRINVYQTDGTTRIFGEPAGGGMSDSRVKVEFDSGINWYGIQSAPASRGRDLPTGQGDIPGWSSLSLVTQLTRQNVSPVVDLNARTHGSQTGPFAWTTGSGNKPGFGILWDNDGGSIAFTSTSMEMNKTSERVASAVSSTKTNTLWFAMVGTPSEITQAMLDVSGKPQMFPKHALGFGNTEWGITEKELKSHINAYRSRKIPLDNYILDFDWKAWDLNDYGNFEWNTTLVKNEAENHYPGFPSATDTSLKSYTDAMGVKLMGITKPRIHVDTVHGAEVTAGSPAGALWRNPNSVGWWLPNEDPSAFETDYWGSMRGRSDRVGNVNFFIPAARAWYGKNTIDRAFDKGIVGYWNDEGDEGPDANDILSASNHYNTLYQEGIYTYQRANKPGSRVWSMNRHSYLGAQRYGYGVWSGDVDGDWRALKVEAPRMLQTINAGMARTCTDAGSTSGQDGSIGATAANSVEKHIPHPELYARWVQMASMQPNFRLHGVYLIQRQPWFYGAEAEAVVTDVARLRAKLMPYIYSHDRIYSETGIPFVRPLMWDNPKDVNVANRSDAWMFGRHLLAAPILEPRATVFNPGGTASVSGTTSKPIYLPAGTWYDYFRGTQHAGGAEFTYNVSTSTMRELPLFIKKGAIIPSLPEALDHVAAKPVTVVHLDMFPDTTQTTFPYYDDDGVSYAYENGTYFKQDVSVQQSGNTVTVTLAAKQGSYTPSLTHYLVAINKFNASAVATGFTKYNSQAELEAASGEGWAIGSGVHGTITYVKVASGSARTITATGSAPGLAIATTSLPAAIRNAPYDAQLGADGLGASATWSVNPALPAGLVLDPRSGRITGVPTVAGSTSYTFQVSSGGTASKALTVTVSSAPFLAHEAFRFTSGGLDYNGMGGENGFAEPWVNLSSGVAQGQHPLYTGTYVNGLAATGLTTTGGAVELASGQTVPGNTNSQKSPEYARRMLTGFSDGGTNGASAWISFIGKGTSPGNGWYGVGIFNGTSEKMLIGQRYGQSNWGVEVAAGGGGANSTTTLSTSAFVVTNIRVDNGTRTVRMWINPTPGTSAPSDASAAITFTTGTDLSFDTLRLRGDSMISKLTVDELRVGSTYANVCGVTAAGPELDVTRGGTGVPDGGTDVVAESVAATAQNLSYTLTNSGTASLSVTVPVTVSGQSNCTATITTQPSATIAAGQTSSLVVSVTPTGAGAWSFMLSATNTDSDENPYNWTVSGTADALPTPELDITRSGVAITDGGSDPVAGSAADTAQSLTYVLSNSGGAPLTVTVPVTAANLSNCTVTFASQPSGTIAAGSTSNLIVSVTPTSTGAWSLTLSVVNNDSDENPYNWTISGTAGAEPVPELDVTRDAIAIADGSSDSLTVSTAGSAIPLTYSLINSGAGALTVTTPVTLSALSNCTATVTTQPSGSLAAGATSNLVLSVTPTAEGAWSFAVSITNTDSDENPYNWTVSGVAASAEAGQGPGGATGSSPGDSRGCGFGFGLASLLMLGLGLARGPRQSRRSDV